MEQLAELHRKLVEKHPEWPAGKAKWIAMRILDIV